MARILIQPEDLARVARRFDAAGDDLARSGRRLSRGRDEVRLNRADSAFPSARFDERSALIEANLRRLAAEFRVDAGLMARTVDDAELDGDGDWTVGLQAAAGIGGVGPVVGSLKSVATGLVSLSALTPSAGDVGSTATRPVGAGGLFVLSSTGGGSREALDRLTERLAGSPPSTTDSATSDGRDVAAGAVWARIVGELFARDADP